MCGVVRWRSLELLKGHLELRRLICAKWHVTRNLLIGCSVSSLKLQQRDDRTNVTQKYAIPVDPISPATTTNTGKQKAGHDLALVDACPCVNLMRFLQPTTTDGLVKKRSRSDDPETLVQTHLLQSEDDIRST